MFGEPENPDVDASGAPHDLRAASMKLAWVCRFVGHRWMGSRCARCQRRAPLGPILE